MCFANWAIARVNLRHFTDNFCLAEIEGVCITSATWLFELFGKSPLIFTMVGCRRSFMAAFGEGYLDDLRQTTEEIKGFFKEADMDGSGPLQNQSWCANPQDSRKISGRSKSNSSYQDPRGLWVATSDVWLSFQCWSCTHGCDGFFMLFPRATARIIELGWISTPHAKPSREGAMQLVPSRSTLPHKGTGCSNWSGLEMLEVGIQTYSHTQSYLQFE